MMGKSDWNGFSFWARSERSACIQGIQAERATPPRAERRPRRLFQDFFHELLERWSFQKRCRRRSLLPEGLGGRASHSFPLWQGGPESSAAKRRFIIHAALCSYICPPCPPRKQRSVFSGHLLDKRISAWRTRFAPRRGRAKVLMACAGFFRSLRLAAPLFCPPWGYASGALPQPPARGIAPCIPWKLRFLLLRKMHDSP